MTNHNILALLCYVCAKLHKNFYLLHNLSKTNFFLPYFYEKYSTISRKSVE